ncbi:MAG: urea transporter [Candidatus Brocadia sp. BROELEC01]|nr:MAG: urea transporter [Candidatus Brocadia sp. BROELEC01]
MKVNQKLRISSMTQISLFVQNFTKILLRGVSQVFLLNNVITGALFLTGIFYNSWTMGIGAIVGVFAGTFTALFLKYDKNAINQGFYGYNGTLVGLALTCFFGFNISSVIAIVFGSVLSSILQKGMVTWKLPSYTAPFIISTWLVMSILIMGNITPLQTASLSNRNQIEIIPAVSNGIGQVMFLENFISCYILFVGILVSSRISALYALLGALVGVFVAFASSLPVSMIHAGLFAFNGVLCGLALAKVTWGNLILAVVASIVSVYITYGIMNLGIITLTSPFVLSTWLALLLGRSLGVKYLP